MTFAHIVPTCRTSGASLCFFAIQEYALACCRDWVHPIPATERYYAVGLFCLVAALLYADQNLMAPNLTQMQHDFGFTDVVGHEDCLKDAGSTAHLEGGSGSQLIAIATALSAQPRRGCAAGTRYRIETPTGHAERSAVPRRCTPLP